MPSLVALPTHPPLWSVALLAGIVGCQHSEPFDAPLPPTVTGPLTPGSPTQLTYNPGADVYPAWAPDGSFLLYQAENPNRPDRDRCLYLLPPTGGTQLLEACDNALHSEDSTNQFGPAALSSTGRVILYEAAQPIGPGLPTTSGMYLAPALPVSSATQVLSMPVVLPGFSVADKLTSPQWVGDSGFLALGVSTQVYIPCFLCTPDTVETGVGVVWTTLGGAPAAAPVPGTARASSYAFVSPDTVYFTLNGDARVLRTRIAGGPVDSVFAFPAESTDAPVGFRTASPAIARGVQVRGGVLYAVTGGRIEFHPDSGSGEIQRDWGGKLHKVTLATGADTLVSTMSGNPQTSVSYLWVHNPVLSSTGSLTAEGRAVTIIAVYNLTNQFIGTDTTIPRSTDLWQYVHP
ncbi:MAG TPA: hypothetical protein VEV39_16010 [Gemmatimonadales bacterium]|nr:hypothetical protein [Gemmatimonadales bacterium]